MGWLGQLNPTPAFPQYTGPYQVGSVDVEIPVSELQSPSPTPSVAADLPTVAFRVFYPCESEARQKGVRWIPSPQREYVSAYARFLGANNYLSQFFSLVPQLLYYISIPVHENAKLLEPNTKNKRWPVMVFSHGLGGSRNSYSHIVGSLASHGIVVVAPDHRDGSSPISFVHTPNEKPKIRSVEYKQVPHKASTEVYEARDNQLRIRLWELGLIHDAILKIDGSKTFTNVAQGHKHADLSLFASKLNVHQPGSISFAGHSFGAATTVQLVKSVYYRSSSAKEQPNALFTPADSSDLAQQITPDTPVALLDLWGLPLQSPTTSYLKKKPMPSYDASHGGDNLLAILSEAFYKWSSNLEETKAAVAKPKGANPTTPGPHIFYPISSAHLSQSDFGVLFPWVTTKVFGAKEPERVLRLNTRAVLQVMRNSGVEVADTSAKDLELDGEDKQTVGSVKDDTILSRRKDSVRGWISLGTDPAPEVPRKTSKGPSDAVVEGEVLGEMVTEPNR